LLALRFTLLCSISVNCRNTFNCCYTHQQRLYSTLYSNSTRRTLRNIPHTAKLQNQVSVERGRPGRFRVERRRNSASSPTTFRPNYIQKTDIPNSSLVLLPETTTYTLSSTLNALFVSRPHTHTYNSQLVSRWSTKTGNSSSEATSR